jgi:23S rRNA pseudouridine1911/1915/1917 synthase
MAREDERHGLELDGDALGQGGLEKHGLEKDGLERDGLETDELERDELRRHGLEKQGLDAAAQADPSAHVAPAVAADATESFAVDEERADHRLDQALSELTSASRSEAGRWIRSGRVRVGDEVVTRPARRVHTGERLTLDRPSPEVWTALPEPIPIQVVFEDRHLIVVDKPAGMVVHPAPGHRSGTLVNALLHHCTDLAGIGGALRPGIVHRLDQGTTGILVVAKDDATHRALAAQFEDHSIDRLYMAVARGMPRAAEGRVDRPIGRHPSDRKRMSVRARSGRAAITNWEVVERFAASSHVLLAIRPETGRTHQIRVHLASVGLPLAGDRVYGRARASKSSGVPLLDRPALHAARLGFTHPGTGERLGFESPLPADFEALLAALRDRERPR